MTPRSAVLAIVTLVTGAMAVDATPVRVVASIPDFAFLAEAEISRSTTMSTVDPGRAVTSTL